MTPSGRLIGVGACDDTLSMHRVRSFGFTLELTSMAQSTLKRARWSEIETRCSAWVLKTQPTSFRVDASQFSHLLERCVIMLTPCFYAHGPAPGRSLRMVAFFALQPAPKNGM
ncbi:uncharacterized protein VTP21DRAFT_10181 [Calcarisporiella thermophila]|uniref:uncharacterized protein n=1 Tax=Calcarisporiella thermophila TaxID=911321 RepID=UPI00374256CA